MLAGAVWRTIKELFLLLQQAVLFFHGKHSFFAVLAEKSAVLVEIFASTADFFGSHLRGLTMEIGVFLVLF